MRLALLSLLLAGTLPAQKPKAFEVVSIKVHQGPFTRNGAGGVGIRFNVYAMTLQQLLTNVYGVQPLQLAFAPQVDPLNNIRYDMEAKAEGDIPPTRKEFMEMLGTVLAERFKLTSHREMREVPGFVLLPGKDGPKLKESTPGADQSGDGSHYSGRLKIYHSVGRNMDDLARSLASSYLDNRPVQNKTGLAGNYDIRIEATPESNILNDPDTGEVSIFLALREQLGLRLEPQKTMVEMVVVDHVEKPTVN